MHEHNGSVLQPVLVVDDVLVVPLTDDGQQNSHNNRYQDDPQLMEERKQVNRRCRTIKTLVALCYPIRLKYNVLSLPGSTCVYVYNIIILCKYVGACYAIIVGVATEHLFCGTQ